MISALAAIDVQDSPVAMDESSGNYRSQHWLVPNSSEEEEDVEEGCHRDQERRGVSTPRRRARTNSLSGTGNPAVGSVQSPSSSSSRTPSSKTHLCKWTALQALLLVFCICTLTTLYPAQPELPHFERQGIAVESGSLYHARPLLSSQEHLEPYYRQPALHQFSRFYNLPVLAFALVILYHKRKLIF